jgi:hypothetical protein
MSSIHRNNYNSTHIKVTWFFVNCAFNDSITNNLYCSQYGLMLYLFTPNLILKITTTHESNFTLT